MAKFIGIGACGNKAVAHLVTEGIIDKKNALLINTTLKDIPEGFKESAVRVGSGRGGCGKERNKGKELFLDAIENDKIDYLEDFVDIDDTVYIVTSTEGGSGSGGAPLVAAYYSEVFKVNTHIIAITGFEDDARGMANTIEFFKEMDDKFIVHTISNKKFLSDARGNELKAEKMANTHLKHIVSLLLGQVIKDSEQNIDETDLYKVVNTPGYCSIEYGNIDNGIKNQDMFNNLMYEMIDNTKSINMDNPSCKRMAIILDVSERNRGYIDFGFTAIKERLGFPYELFYHIQDESNSDFIGIIASGGDMPINELEAVYSRYTDANSKVKRNKDSFFDKISEINTSTDFNTYERKTATKDISSKNKSAFLNKFRNSTIEVKEKTNKY